MKNYLLIERARRIGESLRTDLPERERTGTFAQAAWDDCGSSGLLRPNVSLRDRAWSLHALTAAGLDIPFASSLTAQIVAVELLREFGTEDQKSRLLGRLADGSLLAAVGNSESTGGTRLRAMRTRVSTGENGMSRIDGEKSCTTNAGRAGLLLVSAWCESDGEDRIDLFLLEPGTGILQQPLSQSLGGFRTGLLGRIRLSGAPIDLQSQRLGPPGSGLRIFRRCFHLERLLLSAVVAGALAGLEAHLTESLLARDPDANGLLQNQYVQDKIVKLASTRTQMEALLEAVLARGEAGEDLDSLERELATLKGMTNLEAFDATMAGFEALGHTAYAESDPSQKLLRDLTGFRFFGGTRELQKISLFNDWLARARKPGGKRGREAA